MRAGILGGAYRDPLALLAAGGKNRYTRSIGTPFSPRRKSIVAGMKNIAAGTSRGIQGIGSACDSNNACAAGVGGISKFSVAGHT